MNCEMLIKKEVKFQNVWVIRTLISSFFVFIKIQLSGV